jgi:hypothetical protein
MDDVFSFLVFVFSNCQGLMNQLVHSGSRVTVQMNNNERDLSLRIFLLT